MLNQSFLAIQRRFDSLHEHFDLITRVNANSVSERHQRWRALEGILSVAWQSWSGFCRTVLVSSCCGTETRSGALVPHVANGLTADRIAYVAKCLSNRAQIRDGRVVAPHSEPTWGDRQIILDCARHFSPTNLSSLKNGLLFPTRAAEDMRTVRNAVAHISRGNFIRVKSLSAYYTGSSLRHSLDFLYWSDNITLEKALHLWLSDLLECADLMTV
jgi:hypothetical protein